MESRGKMSGRAAPGSTADPGRLMTDKTGGAAADPAAEPPAPPPTQRRPRIREVSSRFMSPLIQSNSTPAPNPSDFPRSKSVHRRLISRIDENYVPETNRNFDKPSPSIGCSAQKKQPQKTVKPQHSKETAGNKDNQHSDAKPLSRLDTPIASVKVVPSRYRQVPSTISRSNSLNSSSNECSAVTAAARLLQEATSDVGSKLPKISTSVRDDSDACSSTSTTSIQGSSSCPNSPLCVPVNKTRAVPDTRSSMPDVDKWFNERNSNNSGKVASDCARSLNISKLGGGAPLPPLPSSYMRSFDSMKGKKASSHQEDVHSLKMLSNHYLQWRFANAKAEAAFRAQTQEAEKKLYSLGVKISDIRDNVKKKRHELAVLRGIETLSTIIEAQMPYLEEWSIVEEDYSDCLLSTTNALLNSSVRLPVGGDVRIDVGELKEALNSALRVVESICSHIQRFGRKADVINGSLSELAMLVGGERALIEECGYLLCKTYSSQVQECSLMGSIMQLHPSNNQKKEDTSHMESIIMINEVGSN